MASTEEVSSAIIRGRNRFAVTECFWCRKVCKPSELTDDHVVPRAAGGGDHHTNIVRACPACNGSRGEVVSIYCVCRSIAEAGPKAVDKFVRRTLPRAVQLQSRWRKIEMRLLGRSPTGDLTLYVVELPNRNPAAKEWRKVVMVAARVAEDRQIAEWHLARRERMRWADDGGFQPEFAKGCGESGSLDL